MSISERQLEERKMRQERILAGALTVFKDIYTKIVFDEIS